MFLAAAHLGTASLSRPPADRRGASHRRRGSGRADAPTSRAPNAPARPCRAPVTTRRQLGSALRGGDGRSTGGPAPVGSSCRCTPRHRRRGVRRGTPASPGTGPHRPSGPAWTLRTGARHEFAPVRRTDRSPVAASRSPIPSTPDTDDRASSTPSPSSSWITFTASWVSGPIESAIVPSKSTITTSTSAHSRRLARHERTIRTAMIHQLNAATTPSATGNGHAATAEPARPAVSTSNRRSRPRPDATSRPS